MNAMILFAESEVMLYDRSHWGKIKVSDQDRLVFLHNQSTNNFQSLQPGQGCETVFVTSTARTIDLATAYINQDDVLLIVSPNNGESLLKLLDRYIFFADRVKLTDVTHDLACLELIGKTSDRLIEQLGFSAIIHQPVGHHQQFTINNINLQIAVGNSLNLPGYTIILPAEIKGNLWEQILDLGAKTLTENQWESARIAQGRPKIGQELTSDYNPLEVGLWHTISFNKGCYIGQETIARLNTYQGVKQYLWGVKLTDSVPIGSDVIIDDHKVGKLTSYSESDLGKLGLVYLKSKVGGVGTNVKIAGVTGEIIDLPFVSHNYPN